MSAPRVMAPSGTPNAPNTSAWKRPLGTPATKAPPPPKRAAAAEDARRRALWTKGGAGR